MVQKGSPLNARMEKPTHRVGMQAHRGALYRLFSFRFSRTAGNRPRLFYRVKFLSLTIASKARFIF